MYERKKHCYYIGWLPAEFCVLWGFFGVGGRWLLFFWSPVVRGFFSPVPSWPCVWIGEIRELFSICCLCGGSWFAQDSPSLHPLSQSSVNGILFHLRRALVWKIHYMYILFIGEGEIIPPTPVSWYLVIVWNNMKMTSMILLAYKKWKIKFLLQWITLNSITMMNNFVHGYLTCIHVIQ